MEKVFLKTAFFIFANLRQAEFQHCDISLNNFERSKSFQLTIHQCKSQGCSFKLTSFVSVISQRTVFSMATLTESDFSYSGNPPVNNSNSKVLSNGRFLTAVFFVFFYKKP